MAQRRAEAERRTAAALEAQAAANRLREALRRAERGDAAVAEAARMQEAQLARLAEVALAACFMMLLRLVPAPDHPSPCRVRNLSFAPHPPLPPPASIPFHTHTK